MRELRPIWVGHVPVVSRVLSLQQRQEATADEGLAIGRGAKMMWRITTSRDVRHLDNSAEGVLSSVTGYYTKYQGSKLILTSSKLTVVRKSAWILSPAPVQKYPIFLGLMLEAVNGGLSRGGVGS